MPRGIQIGGWGFSGIRLWGIAIGSARSITNMENMLRRQHVKYLYCSGLTTLIPGANPYRIFSPNGGKDWYAVDKENRIIGTAEEIYPGLLAYLDGMEVLTDYARENGPVDPASSEGRTLLESAGFKVISVDSAR